MLVPVQLLVRADDMLLPSKPLGYMDDMYSVPKCFLSPAAAAAAAAAAATGNVHRCADILHAAHAIFGRSTQLLRVALRLMQQQQYVGAFVVAAAAPLCTPTQTSK
jgi:hypothetical protein